jgi:hypothetical protein
MEFASEMIIKSALLGGKIAQAPVTLHPDMRGRPPHLRPWRDGWRHLRFLLMLCPSWVFVAPSAVAMAASIAILISAGTAQLLWPEWTDFLFGNYWVILAGSLLMISHVGLVMALACHIYGFRAGYRQPGRWVIFLERWISLETMVTSGLVMMLGGIGVLIAVATYWSAHHFLRIESVLPVVIGTTFMALGLQTVFGGFLLAVIGGNEAQFLRALAKPDVPREPEQQQSAVRAAQLPGL